MQPDETDEEREEKLPGDAERPFTPASNDKSYDTRPETDSNMDSTEVYQEGVAGVAGIEEPNKDDTVVNFQPSPSEESADDDVDDEAL